MNRIPYARFPAGSNHKSCGYLFSSLSLGSSRPSLTLGPPRSPLFLTRRVEKSSPSYTFKSSHEQRPESPSSGYVRVSFCSRLVHASYLNLCPTCFAQVFITRAFILRKLCLRAVSFEIRVHAAYVRVVVHSRYLSIICNYTMPSKQD